VQVKEQGNLKLSVPIRPTLGQWNADPEREIPIGASPDMLNLRVRSGLLCKRYGYAELETDGGIGQAITGLYGTRDLEGNSYLFATGTTKIYRFDPATLHWVEVTGAGLTGTDQKLFSFATSQNKMVFCQGVDPVKVVTFGVDTYASLNANAPAARFLERFNQRLNLGSTVEGGNPLPFRHRWPVALDHTDWVGLGSGFRDQVESPVTMQGIRKLGLNMALYYTNLIEVAIPQPTALAPFRYETRVADIGLLAPFTLHGRNQIHYFLGTDAFYQFDGTTPTEIAPQVREAIFASLNPAKLDIMFADVLPDTQEYIVFLAMGSDQVTPDAPWVFNFARGIWYPWSTSGMRASTLYPLDQTATWDTATGDWDTSAYEWDSHVLSSVAPVFLTGNQSGKVYKWGPQFLSDDGASIPCRWTSSDFTSEKLFQMPGKQISLRRIYITYKAIGVPFTLRFYTSVDGGGSWQGPYSVMGNSLSSGFKTLHVDTLCVGNQIRFKFENDTTTETFQIAEFNATFELHQTQTT
jgi:hypothetical protein